MRLLAALALLCLAPPAPAFLIPDTTVHEYVNEITGHYVLLEGPEATDVDRGSAGPGWRRTGRTLGAYWNLQGVPLYRFYSPAHNSHFFTLDAAEAEVLKRPGSEWIYEKVPFTLPAFPCGSYGVPVHRLYNNRAHLADANHRFVGDPGIRDAMVAAGWTYEGVAFCATHAHAGPVRAFEVAPVVDVGGPRDFILGKDDCARRAGSCVALDQLAAMAHRFTSFLPPWYVVRNPGYPGELAAIVGSAGDEAWSAQSDPARVAASSFVQRDGGLGIHIVGAERASGAYAGASPMHTLPGSGSERVFPWNGATDQALVIRSSLTVTTLRREGPGAHAYGHPLLQFADSRSGRGFYVTIQAFGSVQPADFVGPDARNGWAIVSTVFRGEPAFGRRIAGDFAACDAQSQAACLPARREYAFELRREDFREVLRRARSVDAALSADPADYFVAAFGFHAETYLDARLGLGVSDVKLELFYPERYAPSAR